MDQNEFATRRQQFIRAMQPASIALLPAAMPAKRNGDCNYPFRQASDFHYLTGFPESEAVAVLSSLPQCPDYVLFNQEDCPEHAIWHGARVGQQGACERFAAEAAYPFELFAEMLPELLANHTTLYYPAGDAPWLDELLLTYLDEQRKISRKGHIIPTQFINSDVILHELRLFKSDSELAMLRYAIDVTVGAHERAMRVCRPGMYEYQIEAELRYHFQQQGCRDCAYASIVAGGAHACVLHYTDNNAMLRDGDLLLIDAGAEYRGYAADLTRTFPVNGRFTAPQQAIYELVLNAQLAGIKQAQPGVPWPSVQSVMVEVLTQGLIDLQLLQGQLTELIEVGAYKRFYMHNSGHWLGLDVHDVGSYKNGEHWRVLAPGMVLTVEPGLYIQAAEDIAEKWWGLGVRIEDDLLITSQANEVLSAKLAKTVVDIQQQMKRDG